MPLKRPKLGAVTDKRLTIKTLPQVLRQAVRVFDPKQGDFDFYDEVERFVGEQLPDGAMVAETRQKLTELKIGLADIAQNMELNNAATAANLGRKTAPSVAEIGPEAGLYNIISGSEAGQVWERLADGSVEHRPGLEAASQTTTETVINAGYFGLQGYPHDDSEAFLAARSAAIQLGIRRVYVPAAPATAFDPGSPAEFRKPHYLSSELPADPDFEWYGDGRGLTNIRIRAKNQRNLFFGESPNTNTLYPNFRIRDMSLWGRSDEYTQGHAQDNPASEHYNLLSLHGFRDFSVERLGTLAPRGDGLHLGAGDSYSPGADASTRRHNRNGKISGYTAEGYNYQNRNGLSLLDIDGLIVENIDVRRFTHAGMPGAVDIEPNNPASIVKNVVFNGGFLQSGGINGVFGLYLNAPLSQYNRVRGIKGRNLVIDGTNPYNGGSIAVQAIAFGETVAGDDLGLDIEFTPQNVARAFNLMGTAGVRLGGTWRGMANHALLGNLDNPTTYIPRDTTIDATISEGEGVIVIATAGSLRFLGDLENHASGIVLFGSGTSEGLHIAPRRVVGVNPILSRDGAHATQVGTNVLRLPITATRAQHNAIGTLALTEPVLPRSTVPSDVDVAGPACFPNKFPRGLSVTPLNGCTNAPAGAALGTLITVIDDTYGADGIGFAVQFFAERGQNRAWVRNASPADVVGGAWQSWQRVGYTPQVAMPNLAAPPTAADFNNLLGQLKSAGVLA